MDDQKKLTVRHLRELARKHALRGYSKLRKQELIEALRKRVPGFLQEAAAKVGRAVAKVEDAAVQVEKTVAQVEGAVKRRAAAAKDAVKRQVNEASDRALKGRSLSSASKEGSTRARTGPKTGPKTAPKTGPKTPIPEPTQVLEKRASVPGEALMPAAQMLRSSEAPLVTNEEATPLTDSTPGAPKESVTIEAAAKASGAQAQAPDEAPVSLPRRAEIVYFRKPRLKRKLARRQVLTDTRDLEEPTHNLDAATASRTQKVSVEITPVVPPPEPMPRSSQGTEAPKPSISSQEVGEARSPFSPLEVVAASGGPPVLSPLASSPSGPVLPGGSRDVSVSTSQSAAQENPSATPVPPDVLGRAVGSGEAPPSAPPRPQGPPRGSHVPQPSPPPSRGTSRSVNPGVQAVTEGFFVTRLPRLEGEPPLAVPRPLMEPREEGLGELAMSHERDLTVAMAQDPRTLFVFWSFGPRTLLTLDAGLEAPTLRLRVFQGGVLVREKPFNLEDRNLYVRDLPPGQTLRVELYLLDRHGRSVRLGLPSAPVILPSEGPAAQTEIRFMKVDPEMSLKEVEGKISDELGHAARFLPWNRVSLPSSVESSFLRGGPDDQRQVRRFVPPPGAKDLLPRSAGVLTPSGQGPLLERGWGPPTSSGQASGGPPRWRSWVPTPSGRGIALPPSVHALPRLEVPVPERVATLSASGQGVGLMGGGQRPWESGQGPGVRGNEGLNQALSGSGQGRFMGPSLWRIPSPLPPALERGPLPDERTDAVSGDAPWHVWQPAVSGQGLRREAISRRYGPLLLAQTFGMAPRSTALIPWPPAPILADASTRTETLGSLRLSLSSPSSPTALNAATLPAEPLAVAPRVAEPPADGPLAVAPLVVESPVVPPLAATPLGVEPPVVPPLPERKTSDWLAASSAEGIWIGPSRRRQGSGGGGSGVER